MPLATPFYSLAILLDARPCKMMLPVYSLLARGLDKSNPELLQRAIEAHALSCVWRVWCALLCLMCDDWWVVDVDSEY